MIRKPICDQDCFNCIHPDCIVSGTTILKFNNPSTYYVRDKNSKSKAKEYRETNRDKIKAYMKAYRETNRDKIKTHKKAYNEANRDKINEHQKAYYEANKDKIKAYMNAYRKTSKDQINAYQKAHRLKRKEALKMKEDKIIEFLETNIDLPDFKNVEDKIEYGIKKLIEIGFTPERIRMTLADNYSVFVKLQYIKEKATQDGNLEVANTK